MSHTVDSYDVVLLNTSHKLKIYKECWFKFSVGCRVYKIHVCPIDLTIITTLLLLSLQFALIGMYQPLARPRLK